MNYLDKAIAIFSPSAAFKRARTRQALAAYEAAKPSRFNKTRGDNASANALTYKASSNIRGYARTQEQNYDLAETILATLVDNVVGAKGISLEPTPKNKDGQINKEFARKINALRADWSKHPEVTNQHDEAERQRLSFRALVRDGEYLIQHVEGLRSDLDHLTRVPYSIELIEADLLPFSKEGKQGDNNIFQGVETNAWGRPVAFHLLKEHPGDFNHLSLTVKTKRVTADRVQHIKLVKRFNQLRGVSIFATILTRLEDVKDYEESERIAARVAAAFVGYIKKGNPDVYEGSENAKDQEEDRSFKLKAGMMFDGLQPGEDVGTIDSNRPSGLLEGFRDTMVRAMVSATRTTFSSVAKKYDNSYSAQRQEQVEGDVAYKALTALFASKDVVPTYERMLNMAVLSGLLVIPPDLDQTTLFDCECRGPAMRSIDPIKDGKAADLEERAGRKSPQQTIREHGDNPDQVVDEIFAWRTQAENKKLVFTTDPKYDKQVPDLIFPNQNNDTDEAA